MEYLAARARREGGSIAELIRHMIQQDAASAPTRDWKSLWEIVGIGDDREPPIAGTPVSEKPDLYLAEPGSPRRAGRRRLKARR